MCSIFVQKSSAGNSSKCWMEENYIQYFMTNMVQIHTDNIWKWIVVLKGYSTFFWK